MKKFFYCLLLIILSGKTLCYSQNGPVLNSQKNYVIDSYYVDGQLIQTCDIGDVMISISLNEINYYGRYYSLQISLLNKGDKRFDFIPTDIYADYVYIDTKEIIQKAKVYSFEEYQKKVKNRQGWQEALLGFAAGMQAVASSYTPTETITYNSNDGTRGTVNVYDRKYNERENKKNFDKINSLNRSNVEDIREIREVYLKRHTMFANSKLIGTVNVQYKKCNKLNIYIPINGETVSLVWDFNIPKEIVGSDDIYR